MEFQERYTIVWIVLVFLLYTLDIGAGQKGYNGCYDEEWMYHGHSHTCIRYFDHNLKLKWEDARNYCKEQIMGPSDLVKIDDDVTNTFIQELLLPKGHECWIGLQALANGSYRWDGFPYEEPQYIGPIEDDANYISKGFSITRRFWGRASHDWRNCIICQHDPFIPQTQIKCPPPTRENTNAATPIECQFYFDHWDSLTMTSPDGRVSTCTNDQRCVGQLDGLTITGSNGQNGHSLAQYNGLMTRQQEGEWSCSINLPSKRLISRDYEDDLNLNDSKSCQLQIYKPATETIDIWKFKPKSLSVVFSTDSIYPKASCHLYYRQNTEEFRTSDTKLISATHIPRTEDGLIYFKSVCHLELTKDDFIFTPGALDVQAVMIPSIDGVNMSTIPDAWRRVEKQFVMESPTMPELFVSDKSKRNQTVLYFWKGEEVKLLCRMGFRSPQIKATVLSCDFPIAQSRGEYSRTSVEGNSASMTRPATRDMDGKKCACWGEYYTGRSEIVTVTFNIAVPAYIKMFSHNGSSSDVVEPGSHMSMWCEGNGDPSTSSITIWKYPPLEGEEIAILKPSTNAIKHIARHNFQTRCSDSGQYVCRMTSTLADQSDTKQDSEERSIRVQCPPTRCDGDDPRFFAKPGSNTTIRVCVFAFPMPDISKFQLQMKSDGNQTWIRVNDCVITTGNYFNFMNAINVTMQDLQPYQFGRYRLYYPTDDGTTPRHISFQLDCLADDGSRRTSKDQVPVECGLATAFIVIACTAIAWFFCCKRKEAS